MATIKARLEAMAKRIAAIERAQLRRLYAPIAREFGMDPDALLDECERFLAMPLAVQLAEVDRMFDADPDADPAERALIKQCLQDPTAEHAEKIRLYRPAPAPPSVTRVLERAWEAQPLPPTSDRTPRRAQAPESVTVDWPSAHEPETNSYIRNDSFSTPAPEPVVGAADDDADVDPALVALVQDLARQLGAQP